MRAECEWTDVDPRSPFLRLRVLVALGFAVFPDVAFSQAQLPEAVRNVGIDQRLNEQVPVDIEFRAEEAV